MVSDAADAMTRRGPLDADVCIVGAGPAGLVVARELVARGRSVVVLESGGDDIDADADALNDGDVVGDAYAGLRATRRRQLGGAMRAWNTDVRGAPGAKWVPLDAVDVGGRWPLTYDSLRPYYERAQRLCGLGPFAYDAATWASADRSPFPALESHVESRVYQLGARDRLLDPTLHLLRDSGNATLLTHATAVRLEASGRRVHRAVVVSPDGARRDVFARRFVLAAGAIENARLLLVSGDGGAALGDVSGLTGRCFMEHPRDAALHLAPGSARFHRDAAFYDVHAGADGTTILGRLALDARAVRDDGLLNASATLLARARPWVWRARNTLGPLANTRVLRRWLPVGGHGWSDHPDLERRYTGFTILLNVEQPPHPDNRVVLGRRRDALGMPVAELHWRWRAEDHARLVRVRDAFRRAVDALGIGRVTLDAAALPDPNAHHHAGTTRMDGDARRGVVDTDCRVHALDNLYVAGASVFPTAGFANPTLTIVALAIRLAERLAAAD